MAFGTRRRPTVKDSGKEAGAGAPAGAPRKTTICKFPGCLKEGHTVATCMRNPEVLSLSLFFPFLTPPNNFSSFSYMHPRKRLLKKNRARRFKTATSAKSSGRRGWRKPHQSPLLWPNCPSTPPPRIIAKLPGAIVRLITPP